MIVEREEVNGITVDLSGPEGNAYALMGMARSWGKDLGWSKMKVDTVITDMKSSDYEYLVGVMDHYFGHFVTFIKP